MSEGERPEPVPELNWAPKAARRFADRTADLWEELLERLPDLPVAPHQTEAEVRAAVAVEVPDGTPPDQDPVLDRAIKELTAPAASISLLRAAA